MSVSFFVMSGLDVCHWLDDSTDPIDPEAILTDLDADPLDAGRGAAFSEDSTVEVRRG